VWFTLLTTWSIRRKSETALNSLSWQPWMLLAIEAISLKRQAALRVDPPRNSQRRRIRPAAKYAVGSVTVRLLDTP
jgi:hypothetical protein